MTIRLLMILEGLHYKVNRNVINYYFQIIRCRTKEKAGNSPANNIICICKITPCISSKQMLK